MEAAAQQTFAVRRTVIFHSPFLIFHCKRFHAFALLWLSVIQYHACFDGCAGMIYQLGNGDKLVAS